MLERRVRLDEVATLHGRCGEMKSSIQLTWRSCDRLTPKTHAGRLVTPKSHASRGVEAGRLVTPKSPEQVDEGMPKPRSSRGDGAGRLVTPKSQASRGVEAG